MSDTTARDSVVLSSPGDAVSETHPLTPVQRAMFIHHRCKSATDPRDVEQVTLWFSERLEPYVLSEALRFLAARHEILRARFMLDEGSRPALSVLAEPSIPLSYEDLCQPEHSVLLEMRAREELAHSFDLSAPPLMRVCLCELPEQRSALVLTFHHILLDRPSLQLVLQDLLDAYTVLAHGATPMARQAGSLGQALAEAQRTLTLEEQTALGRSFAGLSHTTSIQFGFASRESEKHESCRADLVPSPSTAEALRTLVQRYRVDAATVIESAWALILHRYTGSDDLVFGCSRPFAQASTAGVFFGLLPARAQLTPDLTVRGLVECLESQRKLTMRAARAQPEDVLACAELPASARSFDSVVSVEEAALEHSLLELMGPWLERVAYRFESSVPLVLSAVLAPELQLRLTHQARRLDTATAAQLVAHVAQAIQVLAAAEPDARARTLQVLAPAQRRQLLEEWNQTAGLFPRHLRMHDLFERQVRQTPEAIAVVSSSGSLTYLELERRANRLAHALRLHGVAARDRVALCLPRKPDLIVSMLAILKAGASYVPLDPAYPPERLTFMLTDTNARVVLCDSSTKGRLTPEPRNSLDLDAESAWISSLPSGAPPCESTPEDVAYTIYTSGSTGRPKGVVVRHLAAVNLIDWVNQTFQVGRDDRLLFVTSVCFDLSVYDVFGMLASGGSLYLADASELADPRALLDILGSAQITFWDSAPAALLQLVPFFRHGRPSSLRLAFLSGDWIPVTLPDQVRAAFPDARIISLGGATEATVWSNYYEIEQVDPNWPSIPYGRPIRNARYYVLDQDLQPVPIGVSGELHIGGVCLADGYLNRPELNAEKFVASPFHVGERLYRTGDLARFMHDGNIEFLGRIDQQVKIRGFRVELGEIEAVLNQDPRVRTCLVDAPRLAGGQRSLVAYVVCSQDVEAHELSAACERALPEYMVPSYIVFLDALPVTLNGKVDRKALPPPVSEPAGAILAPRTPLEVEVATLFARCLGRDQVGIRDHFFQLGGHSLLAVQLVGELLRQGYDLPLPTFLGQPTVEAVAAFLGEAQDRKSGDHNRIEPDPSAPPIVSLEQARLAFVQSLQPETATYNIPLGFRLRGALNAGCLERALRLVVARHEPLRTSFELGSDGYEARIHPTLNVPIELRDLSGLPSAERNQRLSAVMREISGAPFHLDEAPLLRACLVRLEPQEHALLLVVHHIAFDGPSGAILIRELLAAYDAFIHGSLPSLPPLPVRFNDTARWQLRRLAQQDHGADLAYWRGRLASPLPILQLPCDHPRPPVFTHRGSVLPFRLAPADSVGLRRLAQERKSTVFTTLLAAFAALLHRYSGQPDLVVAIPVTTRDQPETHDLIGLLLNTLVIRSELSSGMTFTDLLAQVRERFLEALEHRELPFERLVAELNPPRDPSITPVFQAFFSYEETTNRGLASSQLKVESMVVDQVFAGTDLSLFIEDCTEHGIRGYFEYSTDLFERSTIEGLAEGFVRMLRHLSVEPQLEVQRLPVMTEEERQRQLNQWNATDQGFDLERSVVHRFEERARAFPAATALVFGDQTLSYGELWAQVETLSAQLMSLGAGPERGVALLLHRSPRLVVALLAVLRSGSYYVPLDPTHPAERNRRILESARPLLILSQDATREQLPPKTDARVLNLDGPLPPCEHATAPGSIRPEQLAYVIFTSGSTGLPKGVEVSHGALTNFLCSMTVKPGFDTHDRMLAVTTISFDIAALELYLPLVTGGSLELGDRSLVLDPALLAQRLAAGVTVFQATPATYRMLLEHGWDGNPRLKALCGGEALSPELARQLGHKVQSLWNMYGPTETTVWSSLERVDPDSTLISIGHPIHNTQMYVLNEALEPVPPGCTGSLYIGGSGLARGYHGRPDLTSAAFVRNPHSDDAKARIYRTGDLARRLRDGRLVCLGRTDFQVKVRGYRVELEEVESALLSHSSVKQAVAHVRQQAAGEDCLVGYVVLRDGSPRPPEDLFAQLRNRLPYYMVPSSLCAVDAFPLTPNGKVDRKALPDPFDKPCQEPALERPRTDVELQIANLFAKHLGLSEVGIRGNFFELGGHSLMAVRLVRDLNAACGSKLAVGTLFQHPTVAELASHVTSEGGQLSSAVVTLQSGSKDPPLYFVCGIQLYQQLARNIGDRSSYGLFVRDEQTFLESAGSAPDSSIPALARAYVDAIHAHRPHGPYAVAGVSFGGLLAFEVARQLKACGDEVCLLVLIDTVLPASLRRNSLKRLSHAIQKLKRIGARGALQYAREALSSWLGREPQHPRDARAELLWRAFSGPAACAYFASKPEYAGPTLIVRARDRSGLVGFDVPPHLGWHPYLTGCLHISEAPGDHLGVLSSPEAAMILQRELALWPAAQPASQAAPQFLEQHAP